MYPNGQLIMQVVGEISMKMKKFEDRKDQRLSGHLNDSREEIFKKYSRIRLSQTCWGITLFFELFVFWLIRRRRIRRTLQKVLKLQRVLLAHGGCLLGRNVFENMVGFQIKRQTDQNYFRLSWDSIETPTQTPSTGLRHPSFNHCRI